MRAMIEDEIKMQKMYSKKDLHGLSENRICFSLDDLKFVLGFASNKKRGKPLRSSASKCWLKKVLKV